MRCFRKYLTFWKKRKKGKKWENIAKMFLSGFDHPYLKSAIWEAKFRLLYT